MLDAEGEFFLRRTIRPAAVCGRGSHLRPIYTRTVRADGDVAVRHGFRQSLEALFGSVLGREGGHHDLRRNAFVTHDIVRKQVRKR